MEKESKDVQAVSEAAKELAPLGRDLVQAGTDLCQWFGDILGTAPRDAVGIILTDPLAHLRVRFGAAWMRRTREILKEKGVNSVEPVSPELLIDAYQGASLNSDEKIRELWARLMAAALDPDRDVSLNRTLIETLKQFDPVDALLFQAISTLAFQNNSIGEEVVIIDREAWSTIRQVIELRSGKHFRPTQIHLARQKLVKIGCLGSRQASKYLDEEFFLTTLGAELWIAVRNDV